MGKCEGALSALLTEGQTLPEGWPLPKGRPRADLSDRSPDGRDEQEK